VNAGRPRLSFEYFPPRTAAGRDRLLRETTPALQALQPDFFSVTYGAGGSTRDATLDTVTALNRAGAEVAPHLSFGQDDEAAVAALVHGYVQQGIRRVVALRGDLPSGMGQSGQLVHADELVAFLRARTGDHFHIEVAAYPEIHPQARSYDWDIHYLKGKFDAGADSAITQYFFNADAYLYFRDACTAGGIDRPVYAGIMPISNFENLQRFSRNCGADIPRWITRRIEAYGDDRESILGFGIEVVTALCGKLLEGGAPGIHFYTMNRVEPTRRIVQNLGC